jgi:hypothetical protein
MTRTTVTRVLRIVFFFWLVLSIALALTAIVALLPMPDRRREYEAGSSRVRLLKHVDRLSPALGWAFQVRDIDGVNTKGSRVPKNLCPITSVLSGD